MCWCRPEVRTPCCGGPECHPPGTVPTEKVPQAEIPRGTRLHQINEPDLATLEREIPLILDRMYGQMDNALRVKFRQIQRILMDVRWNYGPPGHVTTIRADDPDPGTGSVTEVPR